MNELLYSPVKHLEGLEGFSHIRRTNVCTKRYFEETFWVHFATQPSQTSTLSLPIRKYQLHRKVCGVGIAAEANTKDD